MNHNFSDEQLLKMAMGVPDEDTEETVELMKLKTEWEIVPARQKDVLTKRKKMRYNMFMIIKKTKRELELTPDQEVIKLIIDPQLNANHQMNWPTFTFHWDIHPRDHTKIITKDGWFAAGGTYDELGSLQPPAFTEQVID